MNIENAKLYIKNGLGFVPIKKEFRKHSFAPLLTTLLMGVVPGVVLGFPWYLITIVMLCISLFTIFISFLYSQKIMSIKNRLILQLIVIVPWIIQLILIEIMYFSLIFQFNVCLLLLIIPIVLIPVLLGVKNHKEVCSEYIYNFKGVNRSRLRISGIIIGILGMNFAALFRNAEQSVIVIIILICFTIVNSILSVGLLSIQRLYYLNKLAQQGIMLESE